MLKVRCTLFYSPNRPNEYEVKVISLIVYSLENGIKFINFSGYELLPLLYFSQVGCNRVADDSPGRYSCTNHIRYNRKFVLFQPFPIFSFQRRSSVKTVQAPSDKLKHTGVPIRTLKFDGLFSDLPVTVTIRSNSGLFFCTAS